MAICNYPVGIYQLKVNNRIARTKCEICSKLTIKIPERRLTSCFSVFIVNFEHINADCNLGQKVGDKLTN